jgi:protein-disulfide isomerase
LVAGTCYRELRFESQAPEAAFSLALYASPDGRFLTTDLMDTYSDPSAEQRKRERELASKLSEGARLYTGPKEAPVTIVMFSDLECPFCKRAAVLLKNELQGSAGKNVELVLRHFPLPSHAWARTAAEAATCASFQSRDAFWKMHDLILENQTSLDANNVGAEAEKLAGTIPGLDMAAYRACVKDGMSAGLVSKDMALGMASQVRATPTIFVNGRRMTLPRNQEELHAAIMQAMDDASGKEDSLPTGNDTAGAVGSIRGTSETTVR